MHVHTESGRSDTIRLRRLGTFKYYKTLKVYLYRTRPRLDGVREEMVEIKQTKVVYTERESERGTRL